MTDHESFIRDMAHSHGLVPFSPLCDTHITHCNTLQHTATHCNTLQHTATLWHTYITWRDSQGSFICDTNAWHHAHTHTHTCDTNAWHQQDDGFNRVGRHIFMYDMTHMTHSYMTWLTWLNHIWNDWFIRDMHASRQQDDGFLMTALVDTYSHVTQLTWLIYMWHDPRDSLNATCLILAGWRLLDDHVGRHIFICAPLLADRADPPVTTVTSRAVFPVTRRRSNLRSGPDGDKMRHAPHRDHDFRLAIAQTSVRIVDMYHEVVEAIICRVHKRHGLGAKRRRVIYIEWCASKGFRIRVVDRRRIRTDARPSACAARKTRGITTRIQVDVKIEIWRLLAPC